MNVSHSHPGSNAPARPASVDRSERKFLKPVRWLFGRQFMGSLKGLLLYTAYGSKLDPRDWMRANVFPPLAEDAERYWRNEARKSSVASVRAQAGYSQVVRSATVAAATTTPQSAQGAPPSAVAPDIVSAPQTERDSDGGQPKEFWFDYLSDTGDGMRAGYSIAYLCLSDLLVPSSSNRDGEVKIARQDDDEDHDGHLKLPRGAFLFIGGDTAYHMSDYMTLANRIQLPFTWAYEDKGLPADGPRRPLFGIPGNHDYYDQLDGFRRQFLQPVRDESFDPRNAASEQAQLSLPGFYRAQRASYVALRLPFGWWLWGLDTEVGQIDERQRKFFRDLCEADPSDPEKIVPPNKLIVATCAPTTIFGKFADANDGKAADAFAQLGLPQPFLPDKDADGEPDLKRSGDEKLDAGQCRLDISGDVHHYARYWGPRNGGVRVRENARADAPEAKSYASVVCGSGGAFHHPTSTYVDEVREQVLYPPESVSRAEVSRHIFKFWNIWMGGSIWAIGFLLAFTFYFAMTVPQSSRQVLNNFPLIQWLELDIPEPIVPTVLIPSDPAAAMTTTTTTTAPTATAPATTTTTTAPTATSAARESSAVVYPFLLWRWFGINPDGWTPLRDGTRCAPGQRVYFYGPCSTDRPVDVIIGWLLLVFSFAPIAYVFWRRKKIFGENIRKAHERETPEGETEIRAEKETAAQKVARQSSDQHEESATKTSAGHEKVGSEVYTHPDRTLWIVVVTTSLMALLGLLTLEPYNAHITPFGNSMFVLFSLAWATAAGALALMYSEFLYVKSHFDYIHTSDWALPWVLGFLGLGAVIFGLWSFGQHNRPAMLVADMTFLVVFLLATVLIVALPFAMGAELFRPRKEYLLPSWLNKLLIALWHIVLQVFLPLMLIRRGTPLTWIIAAALVFLPIAFGERLMRGRHHRILIVAWLAYGALMLALPYVTAPPFVSNDSFLFKQYFFNARWDGWWGLWPTFWAGAAGAVLCCLWFGWYLAVSFAHNGHNNEVGGAARIERFKEFVRFRVTENDLTAYVIAVDDPKENGEELRPRLVDVFTLVPKP